MAIIGTRDSPFIETVGTVPLLVLMTSTSQLTPTHQQTHTQTSATLTNHRQDTATVKVTPMLCWLGATTSLQPKSKYFTDVKTPLKHAHVKTVDIVIFLLQTCYYLTFALK